MKELLEERAAPAAAGSGAVALVELALAFGSFNAEEVQHLPFGDVKAEAEFIIEFHEGIVAGNTTQSQLEHPAESPWLDFGHPTNPPLALSLKEKGDLGLTFLLVSKSGEAGSADVAGVATETGEFALDGVA